MDKIYLKIVKNVLLVGFNMLDNNTPIIQSIATGHIYYLSNVYASGWGSNLKEVKDYYNKSETIKKAYKWIYKEKFSFVIPLKKYYYTMPNRMYI